MCTLEKRGNLFILTLTGPDEHRLNPTLLDAIRSALRRVREDYMSSSVLITTAEGKFFSNGYDLAWAQSEPSGLRLMDAKLRSVISDLISLPMPTIAAVCGHASAAGFCFALSHDYILMRKDRGFLYMSELDIQLVLPPWFMVLINNKIGSPAVRRQVILTAAKVTAKEGLEKGIIHSAHATAEETIKNAVALGEDLVARKWDGHVYAQNRMVMLSDVLDMIGSGSGSTAGSRL